MDAQGAFFAKVGERIQLVANDGPRTAAGTIEWSLDPSGTGQAILEVPEGALASCGVRLTGAGSVIVHAASGSRKATVVLASIEADIPPNLADFPDSREGLKRSG